MTKKPEYTIVPAPTGDPAEVWMAAAAKLIPDNVELHVVMVTAMNADGGVLIGAKSNMDMPLAVQTLERALVAMRKQLARKN